MSIDYNIVALHLPRLTIRKAPSERSEPAQILPLRHEFARCEVLGGGLDPLRAANIIRC